MLHHRFYKRYEPFLFYFLQYSFPNLLRFLAIKWALFQIYLHSFVLFFVPNTICMINISYTPTQWIPQLFDELTELSSTWDTFEQVARDKQGTIHWCGECFANFTLHWPAFLKLFEIPSRKVYHSDSFFPAEYDYVNHFF